VAVVALTDPHVLALVCDICVHSLPGLTARVDAWPVLWQVAVDRGWVGAATPGGPHRCRGCDAPGTPHPGRVRCRLLADLGATPAATLLRLSGDLDAAVADDLQVVLRYAATHRRHMVVDLGGVHLIDSTVLGLLVRLYQQVRPTGGLVCLAAPSHFVRVVLHTMHLEAVFPLFEDAGAALDRLARHPSGH